MAILRRIGARMMRGFEITGYTRAGNVLRSQGHYQAAATCYRMADEIKAR
jgi:hypothetical protein